MSVQKYALFLLCIISFSVSEASFAKNTFQNNQKNVSTTEFTKRLHQLAPKEFAKRFRNEYLQDSVKRTYGIEYIKNELLVSDDPTAKFWGYYSLAHAEHDQLKLEIAVENLEKALAVAQSVKDNELIMTAIINKGNYYFDYGRYENAMENYLKALQLAKQTENTKREEVISFNIALIKLQTEDFSGANELLKKVLESVDDSQPNSRLLRIYIAVSKAAIGIKDYDRAVFYSQKGLKLSDALNVKEEKIYFHSFLSEVARIHNNFERAHMHVDMALIIAQEIQTINHEIPVLQIEKGEIYFKEKQYEKAIAILRNADSLMQQNKLNFIKLEEAYAILAKSYKEIGDVENSLKYYEKANEVYKQNDKRQDNISVDIIKKYDLQSIKEQLNSARDDSAESKKNLIISICVAIIIVILIIFFYRKREKDNQRKFETLLKSIEEEKEEEEKEAEEKEEKPVEVVTETSPKIVLETPAKEVEIIDETKMKLLKKLQSFETKQLFLNKNSSLNDVAKKLKTNTSYLSKLVNTHKGKSFTAYITDLRVNYAIKRLKNDKKFRSYTIDSIAQEIGFNRSESFSRAFKSKTGLYPSYYIKRLDSQEVE